jgi:thiamine biosynthesis lipoprotein
MSSCLRILLGLLLATPLLAGCEEGPQRIGRTQLLMGTVVEMVVYAPPSLAESAIASAFDEMRRIEQLMSPHLEQSDIWRLSHETGPVTVSAETSAVLKLGLQVARQSGGAFDLSLGALTRLWGIESAAPRVPSRTEIASALNGIGPEALQLEGLEVVKKSSVLEIDLGGIAKGYAIDRAIALLAASGIRHASVNAGGDLRLLGDRGDRPWRIGIQHPRRNEELLATLELQDTAVVTSGDYERFFERDGIRYHHLFDPRTGQPARGCQSVTVVTDEAVLADALATAAFVLGPERGLAFLEQQQVEGLLVTASGEVLVTPGLKSQVHWP